MHYFEPHTGSDCLFPDRVFGFQWKCVNTCGIYRYNWVICGNTRFNQEKICQFSGLLLVTFFGTYFRWFFDRNGLQMPLVAHYRNHVGDFGVLWGFLVDGKNSGLRVCTCTDFAGKKIFWLFSQTRNFFRSFCEPPKIFGIVLKNPWNEKKNFNELFSQRFFLSGLLHFVWGWLFFLHQFGSGVGRFFSETVPERFTKRTVGQSPELKYIRVSDEFLRASGKRLHHFLCFTHNHIPVGFASSPSK